MKELKPSAARLIESLRDTGYTFVTAIADIIDNSVAANANKIDIILDIDFLGNPYLWIADNGHGMSSSDLDKAMQYGSPARINPKSLGKFGMGLKTASTSFCRKLTVLSSKENILSGRQWDLDVIKDKDEWLLLEPDFNLYSDQIKFFETVSDNGCGTIVIWENIDRLIRISGETGSKEQLKKLTEELELHLSGVFYHFISGTDDFNKIDINLNGKQILPWDPFCRWLNDGPNKKLDIHINKPFEITETNNGQEHKAGSFELNVYILPNQIELTDEEIIRARYGLDNQGFHVFREGRMIYSGGWPNRLFVKESHLNLMRVELKFDHQLDHYFQIDIKKSRIDIPKELRDLIKRVLAPARNEANKRYRQGSQKRSHTNTEQLLAQHNKSSNALNKHHETTTSNSQTILKDPQTGDTEVKNKYGITTIRIKYHNDTNKLVETKANLDDGVLWAPGLADNNKHAVYLNESHEFYKRFYLAHKNNSALVLAMDSLLWSMAEAELSVVSEQVKRNLEDLRINVSRSLRILANELPEIDNEEETINEPQ
jgi:hypothetical protein